MFFLGGWLGRAWVCLCGGVGGGVVWVGGVGRGDEHQIPAKLDDLTGGDLAPTHPTKTCLAEAGPPAHLHLVTVAEEEEKDCGWCGVGALSFSSGCMPQASVAGYGAADDGPHFLHPAQAPDLRTVYVPYICTQHI